VKKEGNKPNQEHLLYQRLKIKIYYDEETAAQVKKLFQLLDK
jgi:hypothetical protein